MLSPHSHCDFEPFEQSEIVSSMSEDKSCLTSFAQQVMGVVLKGYEYKVKVVSADEQEAVELNAHISTLKSSQYYILVEAENISEQVARIAKFIDKNIFVVDSNLICWTVGEYAAASSLKDTEVHVSKPNNSENQQVVFRKSKTVLPLWLEKQLFDELGALYAPEYARYEYNLDLNENELKVYLGTYFPRSYAEMFCIFDNVFQNKAIYQTYMNKRILNIFDFCSGTGGELIGFLLAIDKYFQDVKNLNIVVCDGNELALNYLHKIVDKAANLSKHKFKFLPICKEFTSMSDVENLDIPLCPFDIVLCDKVGCEFISHGINTQSYEYLASFLSRKLSKDGLLVMLDVTTKCEETMMFYPQMMNLQINNFIRESSAFDTLLPLSCAAYKNCNIPCFTQQTFKVSHLRKKGDESRVSYRIICHKGFKEQLLPNGFATDKTHIINPIRYQQNMEGAYCNNSKGKGDCIDSFSINI